MDLKKAHVADINRFYRRVHLLSSFPRLALHLTRITLPHPASRGSLNLTYPLPRDLGDLVKALGIKLGEKVMFYDEEHVHRERVVIGDSLAAKRGKAYK